MALNIDWNEGKNALEIWCHMLLLDAFHISFPWQAEEFFPGCRGTRLQLQAYAVGRYDYLWNKMIYGKEGFKSPLNGKWYVSEIPFYCELFYDMNKKETNERKLDYFYMSIVSIHNRINCDIRALMRTYDMEKLEQLWFGLFEEFFPYDEAPPIYSYKKVAQKVMTWIKSDGIAEMRIIRGERNWAVDVRLELTPAYFHIKNYFEWQSVYQTMYCENVLTLTKVIASTFEAFNSVVDMIASVLPTMLNDAEQQLKILNELRAKQGNKVKIKLKECFIKAFEKIEYLWHQPLKHSNTNWKYLKLKRMIDKMQLWMLFISTNVKPAKCLRSFLLHLRASAFFTLQGDSFLNVTKEHFMLPCIAIWMLFMLILWWLGDFRGLFTLTLILLVFCICYDEALCSTHNCPKNETSGVNEIRH